MRHKIHLHQSPRDFQQVVSTPLHIFQICASVHPSEKYIAIHMLSDFAQHIKFLAQYSVTLLGQHMKNFRQHMACI